MRVLLTPLVAIALSASALWSSVVAEERPDAGTQWVCVYGWFQIGENLAKAEQWALALGSYFEARRQLQILQREYPDYETEMVSYRLDWLENEIKVSEERLDQGDHAIMAKYLDFIESFEVGQTQRFNNNFESALSTLTIAKVILDEIISEKPIEFKSAVSTHYDLLLDSIIWLRSQLDFEESLKPIPVYDDSQEWGTTEFVQEGDLPTPGSEMQLSALFPEILMAQVSSEFSIDPGRGVEVNGLPGTQLATEPESGSESVEGDSEAEGESRRLPSFRMSSKE